MDIKLSVRELKRIAEANTFAADLVLSFSSCTLALAIILNLCPGSLVKESSKEFSRKLIPFSLIGLALAVPWKIGAKNFKGEIDEDISPTPCRRCQFYSQEPQAKAFLKHPCALHPSGKPDSECRDWEPN